MINKNTMTPLHFLYLAIADAFGYEKKSHYARLIFVYRNKDKLTSLIDKAKEPFNYFSAIKALEKVEQNKPTGYIYRQDAVCSGLQYYGVLLNNKSCLQATGLITNNNNTRPDAYTLIREILETKLDTTMDITRKQCKEAIMVTMYGGKSYPKQLFGDNINTFHEAVEQVCPNIFNLIRVLNTLNHEGREEYKWVLPDNYHVHIPIIIKRKGIFEIEELDNHRMTALYDEKSPDSNNISLPANFIHSIDAYVCREMIRYCSTSCKKSTFSLVSNNPLRSQLLKQYKQTGVVSARWFELKNLGGLPKALTAQLEKDKEVMSTYNPFPLCTVHDSFGSHVNNASWVHYWYKEIMSRIASSSLLQALLVQIEPNNIYTFQNEVEDYGKDIKKSSYALG